MSRVRPFWSLAVQPLLSRPSGKARFCLSRSLSLHRVDFPGDERTASSSSRVPIVIAHGMLGSRNSVFTGLGLGITITAGYSIYYKTWFWLTLYAPTVVEELLSQVQFALA